MSVEIGYPLPPAPGKGPGLPAPPGPRRPRIAGWRLIGIGYAVVLVVVVLALLAPHRPRPSGTRVVGGRVETICEATARLLEHAESTPSGDLRSIDELGSVLPVEVGTSFAPAGERLIPDAETLAARRDPVWLAELRRDGFRQALIRAWTLPDGSEAQAVVYQFTAPEGALAFQRFGLQDQSCPYSNDVFEIDDIPESIGLQVSWSDGTEQDQVSFVRGPRRYLAIVRGDSVPDRELVVLLAHRLSATAR